LSEVSSERKVKIESKEIAILCAKTAENKKACDIKILEIGELMPLTEFFIILTCSNRRHVSSLTEELRLFLKNNKYAIPKVEGSDFGGWVLLDAGFIVVHLFDEKAREFYDLDNLWADAQSIDWKNTDTELPEPSEDA